VSSFLFRSLYFGIQRLRRGVAPAMVREASRLLDGSRESLDAHVRARLRSTHGMVDGLASLEREPLVERSTLLPEIARLRARKLDRRVEARRTSGSTGTPFAFLKDAEMSAWMDAAMWAAYAWHGIHPGDREARFWGTPTTPWLRRKRRLMDHALHRRRLGAFDIAPDRCVRFFHALRRFRPGHAYGYPTLMAEFAEHCTAAGLDGRGLGLRVVVSTGELLAPEVRQRLTRFFGCPVVNEYGCTESGVLALECEHGTMHLAPVSTVAEVVAPDGARRAAGETGEVVVTDLYGEVLPLRRYRLHDSARFVGPGGCRCGRALDVLDMEVGRLGRFIQLPDGGRVFSTILAYNVPPEVLRFRAHQTAVDRLEVQLLPGAGFDARVTPGLFRDRLASVLGPAMRIEMQVVDDIPYAASGKLRYFVPLAEAAEQSRQAVAGAPA
jgi:phenylacetate-CoA ligase